MQFQAVKKQAQIVMTYLLTLVDGTEHTLVPVDPHGTVMEMPEGQETWIGRLLNGGTVEIPSSQVLMVEEDRYRVTWFNGQTTRSQRCSEEEVEKILDDHTDQKTGEVKFIRSVEDTQDPDNGFDKRRSWR